MFVFVQTPAHGVTLMKRHFHIAVLLVAGLLFGTAQAGCFCASHGGALAHTEAAKADGAHSSHRSEMAAHSDQHGRAPSQDCKDKNNPCDCHSSYQTTKNKLVLAALIAPSKSIAVIASPSAPEIISRTNLPLKRLSVLGHAPPRHKTPVSLKVRLLT